MFDKFFDSWLIQALILMILTMAGIMITHMAIKPGYEPTMGMVAILIGCAWFCGCMKGSDK